MNEAEIETIIQNTFKNCITGKYLAYLNFSEELPNDLAPLEIKIQNASFGLEENFLDVSFTLVKNLWKSPRTYRFSEGKVTRV